MKKVDAHIISRTNPPGIQRDENGNHVFMEIGARGYFVANATSTIPPFKPLCIEAKDVVLRMACPICGIGKAKLQSEVRDFGEPYGQAICLYYECMMCDETFTTTEIDDITVTPLINRKRKLRIVMETIKSILNTNKNKNKQNG